MPKGLKLWFVGLHEAWSAGSTDLVVRVAMTQAALGAFEPFVVPVGVSI